MKNKSKFQVPFCPPKPKVQEPSSVVSTLREDFHGLLSCAAFTDLVLVAGSSTTSGGTIVHAHRWDDLLICFKCDAKIFVCFTSIIVVLRTYCVDNMCLLACICHSLLFSSVPCRHHSPLHFLLSDIHTILYTVISPGI